jgi:rod shape-determining protein MreC
MLDREPRRDRTLPTFVTLVVIAFLLMTFDVRTTGADLAGRIRSGALTFLAPMQRVSAFVIDPIADLLDSLAGLASLRAENAALRAEVARLQAEGAGFADDQARLQVLEQVHDLLLEDTTTARTPANVIGRPDLSESSFVIDKGSDDGVAIGHPVVDPNGYVVGRVTEVSGGFSTVVPISQDREGVTVLVAGQNGILTSRLGTDLMVVEVFDAIEPLHQGDLVVTSSVSISFPPGLPVGEVTEEAELEGTALQARVIPFANLDTLRVVLVITWPPEPGIGEATTTTTVSPTTTDASTTTTEGG